MPRKKSKNCNMNNLEQEVRAAIKGLQDVARQVQHLAGRENIIIARESYSAWLEKTQQVKNLEDSLPCFAVRQAARNVLLGLASQVQLLDYQPLTSTARYCDIDVPIAVARVLAMDSYLASHWALYDRLSNAIGRVIGNKTIRGDQQGKSNPKLIETFLAKKNGIDVLGERDILVDSYGSQIGFSYLVRNCYVHEGGMIGTSPILSGETFGEAFSISEEVAKKLNEAIANRYQISNVAIVSPGDLVGQLEACHGALDTMFVSLLRFIVGTLRVEVTSFAEVDA